MNIRYPIYEGVYRILTVELQRKTSLVSGFVQKPLFRVVFITAKLQSVVHCDIHFFCQFGG